MLYVENMCGYNGKPPSLQNYPPSYKGNNILIYLLSLGNKQNMAKDAEDP